MTPRVSARPLEKPLRSSTSQEFSSNGRVRRMSKQMLRRLKASWKPTSLGGWSESACLQPERPPASRRSPFPCAKINCEPPSAVRVVIYCDPTTFPERIRRVWDSFAVGDQVRNPLAYPQARGGTRRNKHRLFDYSVMPRGRTRGTCYTRRIPL